MKSKKPKTIEDIPDDRNPIIWNKNNRAIALKNVEKAVKRLEGKVLTQVDHKTWVYRDTDKGPRSMKKTNLGSV